MIASEVIRRDVRNALWTSLGGDQCPLDDQSLDLATDGVMFALRDWSMTRSWPPGTRAPADYVVTVDPVRLVGRVEPHDDGSRWDEVSDEDQRAAKNAKPANEQEWAEAVIRRQYPCPGFYGEPGMEGPIDCARSDCPKCGHRYVHESVEPHDDNGDTT